MLRPIAPFVEYAINYDYISKVLCINKDKPEMHCNGKCQLMKKLEQQKEEDKKALCVSMRDYPIGFIKFLSIDKKKTFFIKKTTHFKYSQEYSYLFTHSVFHPPNTFHFISVS